MKKIKYLIILLPLLTGCNYRELNKLGITTAVSIDYQNNSRSSKPNQTTRRLKR